MTTVIHEAGSIKLGAESYSLVRTDDRRAWEETFADEPPWAEGAPPIASQPEQTWHNGALKSREGVLGTSEYGQNTDTRFPFRLLPGPKVNVITLPGSITTPTSVFEALGFIWIVAGRYVFRIDPADDSVVQAKDFGGAVKGVMGLRWEDNAALVTTDEATRSLWRATLGGFQADSFQSDAFHVSGIGFMQTADVLSYRLAVGLNRMFKVSKTGELRNILTGKDPMVEANYADEVQCGEKDVPPTGIIAFERTALVGKSEGMFGVDIDGFGVPLIKRISRATGNGLGMHLHEPYVIFPHSRGLIRFLPGLVESIGLEKETMNESPIKGPFKAFATDNKWLLGALAVGSDTYIMVADERPGGLGPYIWDTWIYLSGAVCEAMLNSSVTSPPRIWFGHGNDVAYIKLSTSAGAPDVDGSGYEFALSGNRFSPKYRYADWDSKDFPKVTVIGRGTLSANRFWDIFFSVDGGAFSTTDIDGSPMRVNSDGRKTFFLPTTAVGREIQYRYDYTGNVASAAGELNLVEGFAVPQSQKVPIYSVQLHLASEIHYEESVESRPPLTQFSDLQALQEQAASVVSYGPWGDKINVWVRKIRLVEVLQKGMEEPEFLIEAIIQRREEV